MKRIQRKRTKGWKMPENCVYVGRPSKWGNGYMIGELSHDDDDPKPNDAKMVVELFERFQIPDMIDDGIDFSELRGKDLACWCPLDQPCHADILLRLANPE